MRARLLVVPGLLGLAVWSCATVPSPTPGRNREVAVNVQCTDENVSFSVNPWSQALDEGDEVSWLLADATQTMVLGKKQSAWPFNDNKFDGTRQNPPHGKGMKGGQKGKTFRYSITVSCQGPAGPREVVIDPDMYVKK